MLDRIDLHVEVPQIPHQVLRTAPSDGSTSAEIRERVEAARGRQLLRADKLNHALTPVEIDRFCPVDTKAAALLEQAMDKLGFSARAYHRIIKVACTIADLAEAPAIDVAHVSEAISYRRLDRQPAVTASMN